MRDNAWGFAEFLSLEPAPVETGTIVVRDIEIAQRGRMVYEPPIPMAAIFDAIAEEEQRDIAKNIQGLDEIASAPDKPAATPWLCEFLQSTYRELRGLASATLEPAFAAIGMGDTRRRTHHR